MKTLPKTPVFAAAIACSVVSAARADFVPVYLGLGAPVTNASERTGSIVAGSGVGVASGLDFSGGPPVGVAQRITPSGAVQLNGLAIAGANTNVYAVSLNGVSVGSSGVSGFQGSGNLRPVKWLANSTTAVELGNLGLSADNRTTGVAYMVSPNGNFAAGYLDKYTGGTRVGERAVLWNAAGTPTELGLIGDPAPAGSFNFPAASFANGVNNDGLSVGRSVLYTGTTSRGARPVRWAADGTPTQLQILNTNVTNGVADGDSFAINANNFVVGVLNRYDPTTGASLNSRAVRWDASGAVQELGNLGTYVQNGLTQLTSTPYAINGSNVAVGTASVTSSNDNRAVRWGTDGVAQQLQRLSGPGSDTAYGINDNGLVVGQASFASGVSHAVLWNAANQVLDLNTLLDPASLPAGATFVLSTAYSITNDGWITGVGQYDADGAGTASAAYSRAFLLQVPEPTSLALAGVAATGLLRRRRA